MAHDIARTFSSHGRPDANGDKVPVFLLAIPAGTLTDLVDRRRLLFFSLTFMLGLGSALNMPAWQALTPELVSALRAAFDIRGTPLHFMQCW